MRPYAKLSDSTRATPRPTTTSEPPTSYTRATKQWENTNNIRSSSLLHGNVNRNDNLLYQSHQWGGPHTQYHSSSRQCPYRPRRQHTRPRRPYCNPTTSHPPRQRSSTKMRHRNLHTRHNNVTTNTLMRRHRRYNPRRTRRRPYKRTLPRRGKDRRRTQSNNPTTRRDPTPKQSSRHHTTRLPLHRLLFDSRTSIDEYEMSSYIDAEVQSRNDEAILP